MANASGNGGLEWRINLPNEKSKVLVPESTSNGFSSGLISRVLCFMQKAWKLGVNEPKKVIHCFKVGLALSLVSMFYYMRPLYDGVGGTAMWAIMTVVVVFEYTVGACLSKSVNRITGTILAGALGFGVHWIAHQSGKRFEPVILEGSVFILAAAATFSRFIPSIKARFDYGAMIFILTFSLVSVSGYRVDKLSELAQHRVGTIAIGTSICIFISMLIHPVWAGNELHNLVRNNMEKLADSLDECMAEYFDIANDNKIETSKKMLVRCKCVLNSKTTEESLANFARWEPTHGRFSFGHPWKQYLRIGTSQRSCAYFLEALNSSINSEAEAPEHLKKHFSSYCMRLSSNSSALLKELAVVVSTMTKSSNIDVMIEEMSKAEQELQNELKSISKQQNASGKPVSFGEIVPLVTISSLLMEIAARTQRVAEAVNGLADEAKFKVETVKNTKKKQNKNFLIPQVTLEEVDKTTMMISQKV